MIIWRDALLRRRRAEPTPHAHRRVASPRRASSRSIRTSTPKAWPLRAARVTIDPAAEVPATLQRFQQLQSLGIGDAVEELVEHGLKRRASARYLGEERHGRAQFQVVG